MNRLYNVYFTTLILIITASKLGAMQKIEKYSSQSGETFLDMELSYTTQGEKITNLFDEQCLVPVSTEKDKALIQLAAKEKKILEELESFLAPSACNTFKKCAPSKYLIFEKQNGKYCCVATLSGWIVKTKKSHLCLSDKMLLEIAADMLVDKQTVAAKMLMKVVLMKKYCPIIPEASQKQQKTYS